MADIATMMSYGVWIFGGVAAVLVVVVAGYFVLRRAGTMRGGA